MVRRYNLYKEGSFTTESNLIARWLSPADFKYIETKEITFWMFMHEVTNGNRCLALIDKGTVLSYLWVNIKNIETFGFKKPLKSNEAFLYTAVTKPELRGNGYAEILRAKCYDILRKQGKDTFYSMTEKNNKSALRFKDKLKAEKIGEYLFIRFWKFKYSRYEKCGGDIAGVLG